MSYKQINNHFVQSTKVLSQYTCVQTSHARRVGIIESKESKNRDEGELT
jgi:hypothetical protein